MGGYGDFWPHTILGKTVGSMCAVCGILVMALPIPIVVDNFADYYQEQKKLEAAELKAEAQAVEEEWLSQQHETAMQGLAEAIQRTEPIFDTSAGGEHSEM